MHMSRPWTSRCFFLKPLQEAFTQGYQKYFPRDLFLSSGLAQKTDGSGSPPVTVYLAGLFLSYFGALLLSHELKHRAWNRVAAVYNLKGCQWDRDTSDEQLPAKLSLHEHWLNVVLTYLKCDIPSPFHTPTEPYHGFCLTVYSIEERESSISILSLGLSIEDYKNSPRWLLGGTAIAYPSYTSSKHLSSNQSPVETGHHLSSSTWNSLKNETPSLWSIEILRMFKHLFFFLKFYYCCYLAIV